VVKIAVITDTHANLPALEAALGAISELGCEIIYHTGDAVGIGPFPAEVLDRLLHTSGIRFVMGNHDALCAFGIPDPGPGWMDDPFVASTEWTRAQVDPAVRDVIAGWPYEVVEAIFRYRIAFLHYPLDADGGFASIIPEPSGADLDALFAGQQADLIFYGHHHPASDHTGRARYINPGSLGCSPVASARFTVVHLEQGGVQKIHHYDVPYDRTPLYEALVRRNVPSREFLRQTFRP
jgi:predicted phosphodiesterase